MTFHTLRVVSIAVLAAPAIAQTPVSATVIDNLGSPLADARKQAEESGPLRIDPTTGNMVFVQDEEPRDTWTGAINIGATLTDGNTNRRTASASADAKRRGEEDRITLGVQWNYADSKDDVTKEREVDQRRTRGRAKYDYFLTEDEKTYAFANASAENDEFSELDLRLIIGGGLGYQFVEEEDLKFGAEVGLTYYDERRATSMDTEYIAATASYHLEWQLNENVKFLQDVDFIPSLENSDDVYVRKDSRLQVTLTEQMFAQFQWVLDYDNTPATDSTGDQLERIDNLFVISAGWSF